MFTLLLLSTLAYAGRPVVNYVLVHIPSQNIATDIPILVTEYSKDLINRNSFKENVRWQYADRSDTNKTGIVFCHSDGHGKNRKSSEFNKKMDQTRIDEIQAKLSLGSTIRRSTTPRTDLKRVLNIKTTQTSVITP